MRYEYKERNCYKKEDDNNNRYFICDCGKELKIEMCEPLICCGQTHHISVWDPKSGKGLVKSRTIPDSVDHECTDDIICPKCGYELGDSWECDDDGEQECEECGAIYEYYRNVTVDYTTNLKEDVK